MGITEGNAPFPAVTRTPTDVMNSSNPQYPTTIDINTTSTLKPEVETFFGHYIGMTAKKRCIMHFLAKHLTMPTKSGNKIVVPTFAPLETHDANGAELSFKLTEGKTPRGDYLRRKDQEIQPDQLGNYITISDVAVMTIQDQTLQYAAHNLGMHLAEVCDLMICKKLISDVSSTLLCTGGLTTKPSDTNVGSISEYDIIEGSTFLKKQHAPLVAPMLFGSQIFGSAPVSEAYYFLGHVEMQADLYALDSFFKVVQYGSSASAHWLPGELGECMGVRFVLSTNIPKQTSGNGATADKYLLNGFMVGRNAYYTTSLGLGSAEFIFGNSGFDPLRQRYTVGYKTWFGCAVNEAQRWALKVLCKTSAIIKKA